MLDKANPLGYIECTVTRNPERTDTMTRPQFIELCERFTVAPSVALESEELREALAQRNDSEVERILSEEF